MYTFNFKKYFSTDTIEVFVTTNNEVVALCHGTIDGRLLSFVDEREIDASDIRASLENCYSGFNTMRVTLFCCYPKQVNNVRFDELNNAGLDIVANWTTCTLGAINGKTLELKAE